MKHFKIQKEIITAIEKERPNDFMFSSTDLYVGAIYKGIAAYFIEKDYFMLDFATPLLDRYNVYSNMINSIIKSSEGSFRACFDNSIKLCGDKKCYVFTANGNDTYIDSKLFSIAGMKITDYNYTISSDGYLVFAYDKNDNIVAGFMKVKVSV